MHLVVIPIISHASKTHTSTRIYFVVILLADNLTPNICYILRFFRYLVKLSKCTESV